LNATPGHGEWRSCGTTKETRRLDVTKQKGAGKHKDRPQWSALFHNAMDYGVPLDFWIWQIR
jgi:hypothetical protein